MGDAHLQEFGALGTRERPDPSRVARRWSENGHATVGRARRTGCRAGYRNPCRMKSRRQSSVVESRLQAPSAGTVTGIGRAVVSRETLAQVDSSPRRGLTWPSRETVVAPLSRAASRSDAGSPGMFAGGHARASDADAPLHGTARPQACIRGSRARYRAYIEPALSYRCGRREALGNAVPGRRVWQSECTKNCWRRERTARVPLKAAPAEYRSAGCRNWSRPTQRFA